MILCDFCEKPALALVSGGPRESRRFHCKGAECQHKACTEQAARAVQPRYLNLTYEVVMSKLRAQHERVKPDTF